MNNSISSNDAIFFPKLQIIEVETYTPCNRTCSYCPNVHNKRQVHYLPMEMIAKIARNLQEMNFEGQFSFQFYNEPLLDKRMPQIVQLVRQTLPNAFLLMYTNGDFLTKNYFDKLVSVGINKFLVTQHEQSSKKHDLSWRFGLTEQVQSYLYYQSYQHPEILYTNRGGLLPHIAEIKEPLNKPCFLPSSSMTITATGNVVLCFEDYHETQIMGNIFQSTIQEIWYGAKFQNLRQQLVIGNRHCTSICKKCNNIENASLEEQNYTQLRIQKNSTNE